MEPTHTPVNGVQNAPQPAPPHRLPVSNLAALDEFLAARPSVDPVLATAVRSLAAAIDAEQPGMAQLVKEYRAAYKELADGSDRSDPYAALLTEMGDASQP